MHGIKKVQPVEKVQLLLDFFDRLRRKFFLRRLPYIPFSFKNVSAACAASAR